MFAPSIVQVDFELAMIRALTAELPATTIRGCFFHYTQCVWRKVQELGLVTTYRLGEGVRVLIRRLAALPLLPVGAIGPIWPHLCARAPTDVYGVSELIVYMERTWILSDAALFPRHIWNHFDNTGPRTNNHLEGFHHRLNRRLRVAHPNIHELILVFKAFQQENELGQERLLRGGRPSLPRRRFREADENLTRLKTTLVSDGINVFMYLDACSFHIKLHR